MADQLDLLKRGPGRPLVRFTKTQMLEMALMGGKEALRAFRYRLTQFNMSMTFKNKVDKEKVALLFLEAKMLGMEIDRDEASEAAFRAEVYSLMQRLREPGTDTPEAKELENKVKEFEGEVG